MTVPVLSARSTAVPLLGPALRHKHKGPVSQGFLSLFRRSRKVWPGLLLLLLSACIEPYEVEFAEPERLLVVEGLITDAPGPYSVHLSYSAPLDSGTFDPVPNAQVQIEEQESGQIFPLAQREPGHYQTDSASVRGQVGRHYRLLMQNNGEQYQSDWMRLKAAPPIDSIYYYFEQKITPSGPFQGLQFYLNTEDVNQETNYYRWQWEETWRYSVPLATNLRYLGQNEVELIERKQVCYHSGVSTNINIATSVQNDRDRLQGQPFHFVSIETSRLRLRYSLLVRQFAMDEEEYLFWKLIKESTENVGSLFDRQPQSRTGNLRSLSNEKEKVLGYFSASGVSEKRIFLNGIDALPQGTVTNPGYVTGCTRGIDTIFLERFVPLEVTDAEIFREIGLGKVFYNFLAGPSGTGIAGYLLTVPPCADCTVLGGVTKLPPFWVE